MCLVVGGRKLQSIGYLPVCQTSRVRVQTLVFTGVIVYCSITFTPNSIYISCDLQYINQCVIVLWVHQQCYSARVLDCLLDIQQCLLKNNNLKLWNCIHGYHCHSKSRSNKLGRPSLLFVLPIIPKSSIL